jgi:hypothetical protein
VFICQFNQAVLQSLLGHPKNLNSCALEKCTFASFASSRMTSLEKFDSLAINFGNSTSGKHLMVVLSMTSAVVSIMPYRK